MLALPKKGMARSITEHNVQIEALCDWIESSVLFEQETVTGAQIVDILLEQEIYQTQDFAWELIGIVWSELRHRAQLLKDGYPMTIEAWRLTPTHDWKYVPGHSFCLALSLAEWLPEWARSFGKDYTEQGELFEIFVKEALTTSMKDWKIHTTGWSKTTPKKLTSVIKSVSQFIGEAETANWQRWIKKSANEAGLDLICTRPMHDGRPGVPLYLIQCASGIISNPLWAHKRRTPDLELWSKLIDFAVRPKRGFATPFAFPEVDFRRHCQAVDGMLLDRYRLLTPAASNPAWVSPPTAKRLRDWLRPRLQKLPRG